MSLQNPQVLPHIVFQEQMYCVEESTCGCYFFLSGFFGARAILPPCLPSSRPWLKVFLWTVGLICVAEALICACHDFFMKTNYVLSLQYTRGRLFRIGRASWFLREVTTAILHAVFQVSCFAIRLYRLYAISKNARTFYTRIAHTRFVLITSWYFSCVNSARNHQIRK